jgi:hypothetical protein
VVRTDAYGGSPWCLEELLEAKAYRRPVLEVNAVAAGEERNPVYIGNVPSRPHDPKGYARIVGRMLLEILRREHFIQHFEDIRRLFNLPDDVKALPYPPEPATLIDLKLLGEETRRFVYPDPPLGELELSRLRVLGPDITVTTPLLLLATEARSVDREDPTTTASPGPTPRLQGRTVGISVGNTPDLARCGMGDQHLNEAAVSFARYLLACGADLAYGGIPQLPGQTVGTNAAGYSPPNFLDILLDLVRASQKLQAAEAIPKARLRNVLAETYKAQADAAFRARWKKVIDIREAPADVPPPPAADEAGNRYYTARSLTRMRRELIAGVDALVLLGGKAFGAQGKYPGLVEEAHLAMEADKPVYLMGSFGGAVRAVIDALLGRATLVLTREAQERQDAGYRAMAALYDRESAGGRADPIDYEALARSFASRGLDRLSERNGLTQGENLRLFETTHVVEMVALVLRGLGRVYGQAASR